MEKKLLIDTISFTPVKDRLYEETLRDPNRKMIVRGILQRAEAKNQNGRIYPYAVLMQESKKYEENFIKERRALGELDHPESPVVNLKNSSHLITEMHWEGKDLIGTVEILTTPSGNILKELFKSNVRLGISSRGMGAVKPVNESTDMVSEYDLISFDFVSNPSTRGAFMFPDDQQNLQEGVMVKNPVTNRWEYAETIIRDILAELN